MSGMGIARYPGTASESSNNTGETSFKVDVPTGRGKANT